MLLGLVGNGKFTSTCSHILTLFYGEKSSCEGKVPREDKPFAARTPQRKIHYILKNTACCKVLFHFEPSPLYFYSHIINLTTIVKSILFTISLQKNLCRYFAKKKRTVLSMRLVLTLIQLSKGNYSSPSGAFSQPSQSSASQP